VRLWSLEPSSPLVFVLTEKSVPVKPVKKDKKKGKKDKDMKDKSEKDKVKVKPDMFGADLDASAVRCSRNVSVLFHMRPAARLDQLLSCVSR
jgi:hypothetical protein